MKPAINPRSIQAKTDIGVSWLVSLIWEQPRIEGCESAYASCLKLSALGHSATKAGHPLMSEEGSETDIAPRRLNVGQVPEAD